MEEDEREKRGLKDVQEVSETRAGDGLGMGGKGKGNNHYPRAECPNG